MAAAGTVVVAIGQFAPGPDVEANLGVITRQSAAAAERGARVVAFPEYSSFFTAPMSREFVVASQSLDGPFVERLVALAGRHGVRIVAGLSETVDDPDRFSNTVVAVGEAGVEAVYRKQHLYDAFGVSESAWVARGDLAAPQTFDVDGVRFGLQTCYDLRFPEVTRRVVDAGAHAVVVPAEWVPGPLKEFHWRTLVQARAIENTVYVVAPDQTAPNGAGSSLIADPMGVAVASLGEAPDIAVATLSTERVDEVRRVNPSLALRRYRVEPIA
jgi:predicted amidohydrolase